MKLKLFIYMLFISLLSGCLEDEVSVSFAMASCSEDNSSDLQCTNSTIAPDEEETDDTPDEVDSNDAPVTSAISADDTFANVERIIVLNYTDVESDLATACSIADLSNITETTSCSCDPAGQCSVGVTGTTDYEGSASFSYTVEANSAESNSSVVSYEIISQINSNLIDPLYITVTPDSISELSVFWRAGEADLSEYTLSWSLGTTAPSSCLKGNIVESSDISGEAHQLSALSSANQAYSIRLCVVGEDGRVSVGTTATQETLPECDSTVSSDETFDDFQTRLDAITDNNADSKFAICINDGVTVYTDNTSDGGQISINTSNVYIYANRSSTAAFTNNRTDSTTTSDTGVFYLQAADQLSLANLSLSTAGDSGTTIRSWSSARTNSGFTELSNLEITTLGDSADGINNSQAIIDSIKDSNFTLSGSSSIAMDTSYPLTDLRKFTIVSSGNCSGDCPAGIRNSASSALSNAYWGDITTAADIGVYITGGIFENFKGITINAYGSAIALGSNSYITNASDLYFKSTGNWVGATLLLKHDGTYITNLEDVTIIKNGHGNSALAIPATSYINSMNNILIKRESTAITGPPRAIAIDDAGWVNSANISNIEVCSESGATAWEDYSPAEEGLLYGSSSSPSTHLAYASGGIGAETFPFDILDGSGLQGGSVSALNIILGGICSN